MLLELRPPLDELGLDGLDRRSRLLARRHEVRLRIDRDLVVFAAALPGQRIERRQRIDVVAEQLDAKRLLLVRRIHFDDVAAHAERAAREVHIVALVLNLHELPKNLLARNTLAELQRQQHAVIRLGRSEAVDARHARDDDDVAPLEQRSGRRQPHPVDLIVDDRFLFDVRVGGGNVGLRLVVVVVTDEILDGILREEAPELLIQLRRERLVVHHHERRPVDLGDDLAPW